MAAAYDPNDKMEARGETIEINIIFRILIPVLYDTFQNITVMQMPAMYVCVRYF
jgi:hypothetical protein